MQQKPEETMDAKLEAVLEAYADAEPGPSRTTLVAWINSYPQFARELTELTARWQLLEWATGDDEAADVAASAPELLDEEQERMVLRGVSAAQRVFFAKRAARRAADQAVSSNEVRGVWSSTSTAVTPISSLIVAAQRAGLEYAALKERVRLSDTLLQKLNRRLIDPRSVPGQVVAEIAAAIQQRVEAVSRYLMLAPRFALGAQHRAAQVPTLPKVQEDFFEAVRKDAALSSERRDELLALARRDASGMSPEP